MSSYASVRMPPPKSWDEFERIVCSAAKNRWGNPNFSLHGRQGQKQSGVDVYGNNDQGLLIGLQCKNSSSGISIATVLAEIAKAENFSPSITHFYVAVTESTDKDLQALVRGISTERSKEGKFGVDILFWDDIWDDLTRDESRIFQHYPQLKPESLNRSEPTHDQRLYDELKATIGFEPAIRLLRDHNFGDPFRQTDIRPLYDFYAVWDQPEKEFIDSDLQSGLESLYEAAKEMSDHLVAKTVPIGNGDFLSVFPDYLRAAGPRPDWVKNDASVLNQQARIFVPIYVNFMRKCRDKLVR
ncbi:hypothetical protein QT922_012990 [Xanthomonas campestris pv. campestris]|uniref:hypothetical protein n=1 Tax=Xanthomonas campestris TaxID=339 RepID=UPI0025A0B480|nr:hypothetical protein [Xanthomonas campestris]MDM7671195.1 hypothetical protein [Xanthomonas campestris pv. campestris]MDM7713251.1 hypothetical protein [Xanthomonas campestris pv. campestris]MEB2025729.1 hypothetical protein [Xanthomonas campestris pv. campestris]